MEDRSATASKPTTSTPAQSAATDLKSPSSSRPLYSSKLGDHRGKDASASGQTARQPPVQQKAWTSASKNPLTGRSQNQQASFNSQNRHPVTSSLREGQRVRITIVSGAEFEGTYYNGSDPSSCRLTQVFQKKLPNSAEIANGASRREQNQMTIQRKDIMEARVVPGNAGRNDGKGANGNRPSFKTDASISNSRLGAGRTLQPWTAPPDTDSGFDGSLEKPGGHEKWDQFRVNEEKFGIRTDYHEEMYTTAINKSHPQYKDRVAAAERKAREIEGSAPATAHVAEERVMDFAGGDDTRDEEEKYSGVRRQADFPPLSTNRENKYTPPARRAPTGSATVKGAPVDPAIIASQLKGAPASKQPSPKSLESKTPVAVEKPAVPAVPASSKSGESKPVESKPVDSKPVDSKPVESKPVESKPVESKPVESKPVDRKPVEAKPAENKPADSTPATAKPAEANSTAARPSATARVAFQTKPGAPSSNNVEAEVLNHFKAFASRERQLTEKARTVKAKADKEIKLTELKKFSDSFKLSTPVPSDLISIIAKDPAKQQAIQEKAMRNAAEIARAKAAAEAAALEKKETATAAAPAKEIQTKVPPPAEQSNSSTPAPTTESRVGARPSAPQHSSSSGASGRHSGPRGSYNAQSHYQYGRGNRPPPHLATPNQATGGLAQRLRNVEQQKMQHPHMAQHAPQDMRLPPTGPANAVDPNFGRRVGGAPQSFLGPKTLNPNSHEFRPSVYAPPFNPAGAPLNPMIPSQGSSPRSSVNNIIETPVVPPTPVPAPSRGQLVRKRTKAVDVTKCYILSHMETWRLPPGRADENDGLRPSFDTPPTWRQPQEETEAPDSTMHLTYSELFERMPRAAAATPNPTHVIPQAHQHQLPFHLQQHGAQAMAPRQSPHMPPMPMQPGQHGHIPHVQYNPDDHRMMHSASAQSFASPRMGQVPMAYPANTSGPMPYVQPAMQPYMNPGAPPMGQFRSFSNNPQFMAQQPHHMGTPMQAFIPSNGMVVAGPMYPGGHPQFMGPGTVPPQPMPGSNGFPSPGRPAAPMMAHQGSHQGQPAVYMSPAMPFQQAAYNTPQQTQGKFSGQRPQ